MRNVTGYAVIIFLTGSCLAWIALTLSGMPFTEASPPADQGQVKGHRDLSVPQDPIKRLSLSSNSEAREAEAASTDEDLLGNGERSPARVPGIMVSGDRLSVHVKNRNLQALLNEISRKSGLSIVSAQTTQDPRVSIDFEGLDLEDGLKRMLSDYDTFFFFGASSNSAPVTLKAVWVYPKGQGAIQASIQNKRIEREYTLAESLVDPDRRAQAVESEIQRNGSSTLDLVVEALKDPDSQVRYRALSMALGKGVNLSADLLQELIQSDASENVRFIALSGIVANTDMDREDLRRIAESLVNDVDPVVQTKALEILDHLQTEDQQPISGEPFHEK
jgi:hypothetical protein